MPARASLHRSRSCADTPWASRSLRLMAATRLPAGRLRRAGAGGGPFGHGAGGPFGHGAGGPFGHGAGGPFGHGAGGPFGHGAGSLRSGRRVGQKVVEAREEGGAGQHPFGAGG